MTKHLSEEALSKLHLPLEDAEKLVEANVKLLDGNSLGICGPQVKSLHKVAAKPALVKPAEKVGVVKSRLGKSMHKLYDLEPCSTPEKPLNVEFDVELYQMENY